MKIICATTALAMLAVSPAFADCVVPAAPPPIPDGNTATMNDMLAANKTVLAYQTATNNYLSCLDKQHDAAVKADGPGITTVQADTLDKARNTAHNAAVAKLTALATDFNNQVRVFKAKAAAASAAKQQAKGKKK